MVVFCFFLGGFWPFGPSFWPFRASFCTFWPFGVSFPFILLFWSFISFSFGLLSFPKGQPCQDLVQNCTFPFNICSFSFSKICGFGLHFGFLDFHFLSFWPFGVSFPFILAFSASFYLFAIHFGLLKLQGGYPLHLRGFARGASPTSCQAPL